MKINIGMDAACQDDTGPVSIEMLITSERAGRDNLVASKANDEGSCRPRNSLGLHSSECFNNSIPHFPTAFGNTIAKPSGTTPLGGRVSPARSQAASPRFGARSPREISMQSPRNRYSPANKDPKWGFRYEIDLNNGEGAQMDYQVGYHVPTLRANSVVRPGTNANWSLRMVTLGAKVLCFPPFLLFFPVLPSSTIFFLSLFFGHRIREASMHSTKNVSVCLHLQ